MTNKTCVIMGTLTTLVLFSIFIFLIDHTVRKSQEAFCNCKQCESCGKVVKCEMGRIGGLLHWIYLKKFGR